MFCFDGDRVPWHPDVRRMRGEVQKRGAKSASNQHIGLDGTEFSSQSGPGLFEDEAVDEDCQPVRVPV
jgi:hypothetical protein